MRLLQQLIMLLKLPPLERSDKMSYSVMPTACCNHQRQHRGASSTAINLKASRVLPGVLSRSGLIRQASQASYRRRTTGSSTQGLGILSAAKSIRRDSYAERGSLQRNTLFKVLIERR